MAVEDYVAVISDDHETDVRDLDVVKVVKVEDRLADIMDTEGITEETSRDFARADGIYVSVLVKIAEDASEYIRAVTRGQLLQWIAESGETLVNDLTAAGFLTVENAADYFGQFDD